MAYKVVRRLRNGRRVSAVVEDRRLRTHYPLHGVAHCPDGMKLLGFAEEHQAFQFAETLQWEDDPLEVWEAEVTDAEPVSVLGRGLRNITFDWARMFWAGERGYCADGAAPTGTIACTSIKLVKKVS